MSQVQLNDGQSYRTHSDRQHAKARQSASNDLTDSRNGASDMLIEFELSIDARVDPVERSLSAALSKRFTSPEAAADELRAEPKVLYVQAADSESNVVKHRQSGCKNA